MKHQVENKTLTYMKTIKDVNTDDSRLLSKRAHLKLQKKPKLSPTREYEYERVFSSCAKEGGYIVQVKSAMQLMLFHSLYRKYFVSLEPFEHFPRLLLNTDS